MKNQNAGIIEVSPIDVSNAPQILKESVTMLGDAKQMVITTQPQYLASNSLLKKVKAKISELDTKRKEITIPLDKAKKAVMDLFRAPLTALEEAEQIIKSGQIAYLDEQERLRAEQEEKLRRQAEKERQEAEAKAKELKRKADEEAQKGNAKKASMLEQKAELQEQKAEGIVAPTLAPIETASGSAIIVRWSAEITDFKALPDEYKLPDMSKLNAIARSSKGAVQIPGVIFRSEKTISSRKETIGVGF